MRIVRIVLKYLLVAFFVLAGTNHFIHPDFYIRMMPAYLPWHSFLVYLSGFLEAGLGLLILVPGFTRLAGWGLIALLIAVFPANLQMTIHHELWPEFSVTRLWWRLPLQIVFIVWVYFATLSKQERLDGHPG